MTTEVESKKWYVVQVYSGMEKSVERILRERIAASPYAHQFGEILVPTEEVMEIKNGQKAVTERRFFPGYILVEMLMSDETWHLVKKTNKVSGFLGGKANRPPAIPYSDVEKIRIQMQDGVQKPKPKTMYEIGQSVRVKEGPFADFNGHIEEVNYDKSRVRISVTIFGRATPVDLEFGQVEKT